MDSELFQCRIDRESRRTKGAFSGIRNKIDTKAPDRLSQLVWRRHAEASSVSVTCDDVKLNRSNSLAQRFAVHEFTSDDLSETERDRAKEKVDFAIATTFCFNRLSARIRKEATPMEAQPLYPFRRTVTPAQKLCTRLRSSFRPETNQLTIVPSAVRAAQDCAQAASRASPRSDHPSSSHLRPVLFLRRDFPSRENLFTILGRRKIYGVGLVRFAQDARGELREEGCA